MLVVVVARFPDISCNSKAEKALVRKSVTNRRSLGDAARRES